MSLLTLRHVSKRFDGRRPAMAVDDVSLDVDRGERVTIWGPRHSGRTTLLRIAAGITQPDQGVAMFDGIDLAQRSMLGAGIGWCRPSFDPMHGRSVLDHLEIAAHARRRHRHEAQAAVTSALSRVDALEIGPVDTRELDPHERIRAGIARALVGQPRLLMLDDPTLEVGYAQRDSIQALLASFAAEGIAVLASVSDAMAGVDRMLTIHDGRIHGDAVPSVADVVQLREVQ